MTATTTKHGLTDLTATTRTTTTKHKSITMSLWAHAVVLVVLAGVVAAAAEVSYNNNNNDPFGLKCKLLALSASVTTMMPGSGAGSTCKKPNK